MIPPALPAGARILGVVLAGGLSRRMGTDKASLLIAGTPAVQRAIDRLKPQVSVVIVNANGDPARLGTCGVPVVADTLAGHPGPLAGVLAAMRWAATYAPEISHVVSVPVDAPVFPDDLVARLAFGLAAVPGAQVAYAASPSGPQPVFALLDIQTADDLERDIMTGTAHRVVTWLKGRPHAEVAFATDDPFVNLNTPDDLAAIEAILARR